MKAQVIIIELITVVSILLVAFGTLLPSLTYKNRWSDATLLLTERDLVLAADRSGKLSSIAFDPTAFNNFVSQAIGNTGIIFWSTYGGTFGTKITVACNCTANQISDLNQWIGTFELNQRQISLDFVPSTLDKIPASNVLFIFGQKNLEPYKSSLLNYLAAGNGIVQMANLQQNDITPVYQQIFGITNCQGQGNCGSGSQKTDTINSPSSTSDPFFTQYNLFYHLPMPISAPNSVSSVPVENGLAPCGLSPINEGNFTIQQTPNDFWICGSSVYFDTNGNQKADVIISARQSFALSGFNFFMSYIGQNYVYIAFRPNYTFNNFLDSNVKLLAVNGETNRVFVQAGTYSGGNSPVPVVVVNGTVAKAAWIADFTSQSVGDDEKLLLASLIFASANVRQSIVPLGTLQTGLLTSYINVANYDMLEVYRFDVGGGYPF